ncbi:MAG: tRNA pseudouridine(38-40) synthase TruA [Pseudomonadota bacterium]|nr:tRNA pseudouridine(38-40) synthase TruA [Pseudomonadota bacterium]
MRVALGLSYRGQAYRGWQSQAGGDTVQDHLEAALAGFVAGPVRVRCAGRTDAGVHALNQVVHLDTDVEREPVSWVRGTNRFLPRDIAVQWARPVAATFDARFSALGRRYVYVLLESPVRPGVESGMVGWTFRPLDLAAMEAAAQALVGEHDFSALRSSQCQAATPVRTLRSIRISRRGAYWRFDFDANAFLHHMVRNIIGCLVAVGNGGQAPEWIVEVLASRDRSRAAPTFAPDGLYFAGPYYDAGDALPDRTAASDWLP